MSAIRRFTPIQRVLHWLMAIAIVAMLFIGVGMVSTIVRLRRGSPPLPADMPEAMKLAAGLSHVALYVLMIALPLIGWAMLSAADYPIYVLGARLPSLVAPSNAAHTLLWNAHRFLALCFFALILLHFAAGLFHALVRRDGVFEAMSLAPGDPSPQPLAADIKRHQ